MENKEKCIPFEEDYEDIKNNKNVIWNKYQEDILKLCSWLGYSKGFDKNELMQHAYLLFVKFCDKYDPYYLGNFIPFNKYFFSNLKQFLQGFIQKQRKKQNRYQYDFEHTNNKGTIFENNAVEYFGADIDESYKELEFNIELKIILDQFPETYRDVILYKMKGYTQKEVGDLVGISQSRVSSILRSIKNPSKSKTKNSKLSKKLIDLLYKNYKTKNRLLAQKTLYNPLYKEYSYILDSIIRKPESEYIFCKRWYDFYNFYEDMGEEYEENYVLIIKDDKKEYKKENCYWFNPDEYLDQYCVEKKLLYKGKLVSLKDLSKINNVRPFTIIDRVRKHWTVEKAVSKNEYRMNIDEKKVKKYLKETNLPCLKISKKVNTSTYPVNTIRRNMIMEGELDE